MENKIHILPALVAKLAIFLCALFILSSKALVLAEADFSQRIEWRADEGAYKFRVQVESDGKRVLEKETEQNFLNLDLEPGKYRYRVYVYDFLGRESSVSEWTDFEIFKAAAPEIRTVQQNVSTTKKGNVELSVDIENISEGSTVELIAENIPGTMGHIQGEAGGSETGRTASVSFENVPSGRYRLKVTNPSGSTTESDVIVVRGNGSAPAPIATPAPEPEPEPKQESEPPQEEAATESPGQTAEETPAEESVAKEPAPKPKKQKKPREPWVIKDIYILPMVGLQLSPYDGTLFDFNDAFPAVFGARLSWLPMELWGGNGGLELCASYGALSTTNDFYAFSASLTSIQVAAFWRHRILLNNLYAAGRAGFGFTAIQQKFEYKSFARTNPESELMGYLSLTLGAAIQFIPFKFCALQAGIDFSHTFIQDMPTGIILPYVSIGLRL